MATTVTPKVAALIEQGMQLVRAGEFLQAARAFERALQQMPGIAEVHGMHAEALLRAGRLDAALAAVQRALRLRPGWGDALVLRGNILLEQLQFAEALAAYGLALQGGADPRALETGSARALLGLGRRAEAEAAWKGVLERDPRSVEALEQLMQIYTGDRRFDELDAVCVRGIALDPVGAIFRIFRGFAAWQRGHRDEALAHYRDAARVAEGIDAEMFHEANKNEAMTLFMLGRLREGWERYRWRLDREALRARYPLLAAEPAALAACAPLRIRIHQEQGIGDELFFLRFAAHLRAKGHRLSYRAEGKLVRLLAGRADLFEEVGPQGGADALPCDVELQSSDLAVASGHEFALPLPLAAEAGQVEAAAARLRAFGPAPYIGVTWAAGASAAERDPRDLTVWVKRVAPAELGAALRPVRARIVILQRKPEAGDASAFCSALGRPALDASDVNEDLRKAVALLAALDDYVGPSNTNMHLLAGLGGRRARVLTQEPAEWRWGIAGETSPWFPGFKLYRQGSDGSWSGAWDRLRADLELLIK